MCNCCLVLLLAKHSVHNGLFLATIHIQVLRMQSKVYDNCRDFRQNHSKGMETNQYLFGHSYDAMVSTNIWIFYDFMFHFGEWHFVSYQNRHASLWFTPTISQYFWTCASFSVFYFLFNADTRFFFVQNFVNNLRTIYGMLNTLFTVWSYMWYFTNFPTAMSEIAQQANEFVDFFFLLSLKNASNLYSTNEYERENILVAVDIFLKTKANQSAFFSVQTMPMRIRKQTLNENRRMNNSRRQTM